MPSSILSALLTSEHPVYKDNHDLWLKNQRRLDGGEEVLECELNPFEWEKEEGAHFESRQQEATYVNFPRRFARKLVGQLSRKAPQPGGAIDFGTLGQVDETTQGSNITKATQLWTNADGQGRVSSSWPTFWNQVQKKTLATGHRWVFVEAPSGESGSGPNGQLTQADERRGARPYLVDFSPLAVPNWHIGAEGLNWVVIRLRDTEHKVENGKYVQEETTKYYLHVRRGFDNFDHDHRYSDRFQFSDGGWWMFSDEGDLINEEKGVGWGDYEATNGQIPMIPFFYQRADNTMRREGKDDRHRMSRPAITELGQIATSYLNLGSAGDNDAFEAGSRTVYLLGIGQGEHEDVVQQQRLGARLIGVPFDPETGKAPELHDTGSVSAGDAVETRQNRKMEEAQMQASDEIGITPGESGISKQRTFQSQTSPMLAQLAENREEAEQAAITFLEQRWGASDPTGTVSWEREYDLESLLQSIQSLFEVLNTSTVSSASLESELIVQAVRDQGFDVYFEADGGPSLDEVRQELVESANRRERLADATLGPGPAVAENNDETQQSTEEN